MNLLKLLTDPRVKTILSSMTGVQTGGIDIDSVLDLGVRYAPTLSLLLKRDISSIDEQFVSTLADTAGVQLAGAERGIAQLFRDEGQEFKGTILEFLTSDRGKHFLRRFVRGGADPEPTRCPECGHVTF